MRQWTANDHFTKNPTIHSKTSYSTIEHSEVQLIIHSLPDNRGNPTKEPKLTENNKELLYILFNKNWYLFKPSFALLGGPFEALRPRLSLAFIHKYLQMRI